MSLLKPPIQVPVTDSNGLMSREWTLFFVQFCAKVQNVQLETYSNADALKNSIYYSSDDLAVDYKDDLGNSYVLY